MLIARCPRRALRLDHGRRQSAQLPSLAEMARHREPPADRRGGPRQPEPLRHRRHRRSGPLAFPHARKRRASLPPRHPPAWVFLHGLNRRCPRPPCGRCGASHDCHIKVAERPKLRRGIVGVESINRTLSCCRPRAGCPGRRTERIRNPVHYCAPSGSPLQARTGFQGAQALRRHFAMSSPASTT